MTVETAEEIAARYGCVLAEGAEVQRIKPGTSGLPPLVWDARAGRLVIDSKADKRELAKAAMYRYRARQAKDAAMRQAAANEVVAACHAQGMTTAQIAEQHGLSVERIRLAYNALGVKAHKAQPQKGTRAGAASRNTETVEKVREYTEAGFGVTRTAKLLGLSRETVRYIRKAHGFERANIPQQKREATPVAKHHEKIVQMRSEGYSLGLIAKAIDVPLGSVRSYVARWKITAPATSRQVKRCRVKDAGKDMQIAAQSERRAEIQRIYDEKGGLPLQRKLAEQFGVSSSTIQKDIFDMGLTQRTTKGPNGAVKDARTIGELMRAGKNTAEIAGLTGYSKSAVRRAARAVCMAEAAQ